MRRGGVTAQTAEERKARSAYSSRHVSPSPVLHGKPAPPSSPAQPQPQCNMTLPVVFHTITISHCLLHFYSLSSPAQPQPQSNMTLPLVFHTISHCLLHFYSVHLHKPQPQSNMTLPVALHLHNHTHNTTWHFLLYFTCTTIPTIQYGTSCCTSPAQPHPQYNMTLPVVIHPVSHCLLHWFLWVHLHNHTHNATWHFLLYFTCTTTPTMQHDSSCCTSPAQPHPQCNMTLPVVLHLHNHTHNTWHFLLLFTQSHTACRTGFSEFTCTTTPTMQHDTSCCSSPSLTLPATPVPLSSPAQPHPQCSVTLPVVLHPSHTACNTGFSEFSCTTTPMMQHDTYHSVSH